MVEYSDMIVDDFNFLQPPPAAFIGSMNNNLIYKFPQKGQRQAPIYSSRPLVLPCSLTASFVRLYSSNTIESCFALA